MPQKANFHYHNSNSSQDCTFIEESPISINKVCDEFLMVRNFGLVNDSYFSWVCDDFVDHFLLQKMIQNPGKSWEFEKKEIADATAKLKTTAKKTAKNRSKSSKMAVFRQNW